MTTIRIPTPLRQYTNGQAEIAVAGPDVGAALADLTGRHPALRGHLYTEGGELRAFVNVFLNDEDVRHLQGAATPIGDADRLMIVPSIAGGLDAGLARVDHSALRVNQAAIIALLVLGFIVNTPWLVVLVAAVMTIGSTLRRPGFRPLYASVLKPLGWVKPDVIADNAEPHVFAQGLGAAFLWGAVIALFAGAAVVGWALTWLVIALAALNLFVGFCAGCFVYYWLARLKAPGFLKTPPAGTFPGLRPRG
jgi:molybdopterin converting factor small subunit